jgi:hypothetical protein
MTTDIMNKYDEKYTNILEDGEVSEEMLNIGLGLFGLTPNDDIGEFRAIVSNGLSTVFTHHKGVPHAYQCFVHKETSKRIINLLSSIKPVEFSIKNDDSSVLRYDMFEYMPKIIDHGEDYNMIKWELITPLNSYTNSEKCNIITNNIVKLLWDIGKAIVGLHENGIYHGDSRIDNIGIKNGKFVLFDFDGSRSCSPKDKHIYKDFSDFAKSIEFNVNYYCENNSKPYDKIKEYIPFPDNYFIESIIEKNDSIEFLDSLEIIV